MKLPIWAYIPIQIIGIALFMLLATFVIYKIRDKDEW